MEKLDIKSFSIAEIKNYLKENNIPQFHGEQIFVWLHKGVDSFDEMTDLSIKLRTFLDENFYIYKPQQVESINSTLDETTKYLFTFRDGEYTESVLLKYNHGYSVCLSTQAGCKMGCKFCASSHTKFSRNLTVSEILTQIDYITRDKRKNNPEFAIHHIVLMGIGEPLDNYDNTVKFLRIANDKKGYNIGLRNISVSTCGLCEKIKMLANEDLPITLSVSLHAPDNKTRDQIMPINQKHKIEELISTCKEYSKITNRRISFEYAMIRGINDTPEHARTLKELLKGMLCHVNLIPLNEIKENEFKTSTKEAFSLFTKILKTSKIEVTVRRTLGADINAACGQLRKNKIL